MAKTPAGVLAILVLRVQLGEQWVLEANRDGWAIWGVAFVV